MEITVSPSEEGQKILKYLLRRTDGSKVFLFKLFRKGRIRLNGRRAADDDVLRAGDTVSCPELDRFDKPEATTKGGNVYQPVILFEKNGIIAIDKPAGLLSHPAPGGDADALTLMRGFLSDREGVSANSLFLEPAHRLDRGTAGVLLFASSYESARSLANAFHEGSALKTYRALLDGSLAESMFIQADIFREANGSSRAENVRISGQAPDRASWLTGTYAASSAASATVVRPLETRISHTLAEIDIWTGRHHQIRVVCSAAGHPLSGDRRYGGSFREGGFSLVCRRIAIPELGFEAESRQHAG